MSETIRVSPKAKEALLRVAARLQGQTGKRVDFDDAIIHLVQLEDKDPQAFKKFVGSAKVGAKNPGKSLLDELARERKLDEIRSKRKYGV